MLNNEGKTFTISILDGSFRFMKRPKVLLFRSRVQLNSTRVKTSWRYMKNARTTSTMLGQT